MASKLTAFEGAVPFNYDRFLGPLLFDPYAQDLADRVRSGDSLRALELACGTGRLTARLLDVIGKNGGLTATDLNPDMLAIAKEKIVDGRVQWQVANAQELAFDDEAFDMVVCQFGIMFFQNKLKALQEAHRVLKPGGQLLFNTWDNLAHNPGAAIVERAFATVFPDNPPDFMVRGPYSFFDETEIRRLMEAAGFQHLKIEKVQMVGRTAEANDIAEGFIKGTPMAAYLKNKPASSIARAGDLLRSSLIHEYGGGPLEVPMQAILVTAEKG